MCSKISNIVAMADQSIVVMTDQNIQETDEKIEQLLIKGDIGGIFGSSDAYIQQRISSGQSDIVAKMLARDIDIHTQDDAALRYSAWHGQTNVVYDLLKLGANVHARNNEALMMSCRFGFIQIVRALIECSDIRSVEKSALKECCARGQTEIMDLLLGHGAQVSNDLLWCAIRYDQPVIVQKLLECEINPNIDNGAALMMSCYRGRTDIAKILIKWGAMQ